MVINYSIEVSGGKVFAHDDGLLLPSSDGKYVSELR